MLVPDLGPWLRCDDAVGAGRVGEWSRLMSLASFAIVLVAAVLHAGWNLVVKGSTDKLVATWAILSIGGVAGSIVLAIEGLPSSSTTPWLAASALVHVLYPLALAASYEAVDLSVAYPIARGAAPMFVAVAGVLLLDDSISPSGAAGLVAIVTGVVFLAKRLPTRAEMAWPLATGLTIAAYTVLDGGGVRAGDESLRFISALFALSSVGLTTVVLTVRGPRVMIRQLRTSMWHTIIGGLASAGAYLLVLIAARTNPLGLVAGLRETSAAFGVLGAVVFLDEQVSRKHFATVVLMVAGAALIVAF